MAGFFFLLPKSKQSQTVTAHIWLPPLPSLPLSLPPIPCPPPSGVFITKGDIGLGTIVGSAVFNILVIIGLSGIFAGQVWKTYQHLALSCSWRTISGTQVARFRRNRTLLLTDTNSNIYNVFPQTVVLTWWSLFRDSSYYILAVLTLIMVRSAFLSKTIDVLHFYTSTKCSEEYIFVYTL